MIAVIGQLVFDSRAVVWMYLR